MMNNSFTLDIKLSLVVITATVLLGLTVLGRSDQLPDASHSSVTVSNPMDNQILKIKPQADRNGDGTLSDAEKAAMKKMIIKRFPKSDSDGDGTLSEKELEVVIRIATARAQKQGSRGQGEKTGQGIEQKMPTHADVKYGKDERNVFDIWLAESNKPTPLAIYIHGGGFRAGSKEKLSKADLNELLKAGISVASINYRYASADAPLPSSHHDARRALQFMRSNSKEWNLDKSRVAAFGGSAGAQICMWLAYSEDMVKLKSKNPLERESTRLTCVATSGGQTTLDVNFWQDKIATLLGPKTDAGSLFPSLGKIKDPQKARIARWGAKTVQEANEIATRHSALSIVSKDGPPIFMSYGMPPTAKPPTDKTRVRGWLVHHVNLGIALKEKADTLKLEAHLKYPGAELKYTSQVEFLIDKLLN